MNRRSFLAGAGCTIGGAVAIKSAEIALDHAVIDPWIDGPPTRIYTTPLPWDAFEAAAPARQCRTRSESPVSLFL